MTPDSYKNCCSPNTSAAAVQPVNARSPGMCRPLLWLLALRKNRLETWKGSAGFWLAVATKTYGMDARLHVQFTPWVWRREAGGGDDNGRSSSSPSPPQRGPTWNHLPTWQRPPNQSGIPKANEPLPPAPPLQPGPGSRTRPRIGPPRLDGHADRRPQGG